MMLISRFTRLRGHSLWCFGACLLLCMGLLACGEPTDSPESPMPDEGGASGADLGVFDGGSSEPDAEAIEADGAIGQPDAESGDPDVGASAPDGGTIEPDAAVELDVGVIDPDAALEADALPVEPPLLDQGVVDDLWTTERVYAAMRPLCVMCHGEGQSLPAFGSLDQFRELIVANDAWIVAGEPDQSAFLGLMTGAGVGNFVQMPPGGLPYSERALADAELPTIANLSQWIESLEAVEPPPEPPIDCWEVPGPKAIHRLNRLEYNHAVRALLDTEGQPANDFPSEDNSYGLDNIADALTVSPLLVEKYHLAAEALAFEALPVLVESGVFTLEGENMQGQRGRASGSYWNLWSNGTIAGELDLVTGGIYALGASVAGGQAGPDPVRFELTVDGVDYGPFETRAQSPDFEVVDAGQVELAAGLHAVSITFTNDYYCPQDDFDEGECDEQGDRNLLVDFVELEGPQGGGAVGSRFEARFLEGCDLAAEAEAHQCARDALDRFARLVWRRDPTDDESGRLWDLVSAEFDEPEGLRAGLRQAVHALLLSPNFLFRVETAGEPGQGLSGYERAARLAAFLWRSVPDEALLDRAAAGELDTPDQMALAAREMLQDPRGMTMVDDLGEQWLLVRQAEFVDPEYDLFPDFDEALRASMIEETRRVFRTLWSEQMSLLDIVSASFTFVNERLATHYGMEGIEGEAFQRIDLPAAHRQGVLTHASWLSATSQRTRTSPVKRGKWVLEELLCSAPPPPPPNVEGLIEEVDQDASLRERLEQHRADPACAACHRHMDTIGFGLERFDAVGAYRTLDQGEFIDPSGALLGETPFEDAADMSRAIRQHPNLGPCMLNKMIIFALGRGFAEEEACFIEAIDEAAAAVDYRTDVVVEAIVRSPLFTVRGAEPPEGDLEGGAP